MIMADMYLIEERFIGSVDRGFHEILPRSRLDRDRSTAEVVDDDVPDALVGVHDAHRTQP
jgi:hypothetical protein